MASHVLNHDLPCCQCSYNLRGLGRAHRCPECGCFVTDSIERFFKLAATGNVRRLNWFDKFCAILAMALAVVFLLLGIVGFFAGTQAYLILPPVLGVLPALVGWGIIRSVLLAWRSGKPKAAPDAARSVVRNLSIYRDPIPILPEEIDREIERLAEPWLPFGPLDEIPADELDLSELDEKSLRPHEDKGA